MPYVETLPSYIPREWWDRVEVVVDERGVHYCWTGWNNGEGHGKAKVDGRTVYTHREIYERCSGVKLGRFDFVDHGCERKPCMNFDHLEAVPPAVNTARGPGRHTQYRAEEPPF